LFFEDFTDGIGDWSRTNNLNGGSDWYQSNSVRLFTTGGSTSYAQRYWDNGMTGDWDSEIDFEILNPGTTGQTTFYYNISVGIGFPDQNRIRIFKKISESNVTSQIIVNNVVSDQSTSPAVSFPSKFRIVKSGTTFTTYFDLGSGFQQDASFVKSGWDASTFTPLLYLFKNGSDTPSFKVNSFTVTSAGGIVSTL